MLTILQEQNEIAGAQQRLVSAFQAEARGPISVRMNHQGGKEPIDVWWSDRYKIWMSTRLISGDELSHTGRLKTQRYWNSFGTQHPVANDTVNITCEINTPFSGIDRSIAAAFAADDSKLILFHRGLLSMRRREDFKKHFKGQWLPILDGTKQTNLAFVCDLSSPQLLEQLRDFIYNVQQFKDIARGKEESPPDPPGKDWDIQEVEATVEDYFAMLDLESRGETYKKTEHNARLRSSVKRSKGAIEMKHQNISAVLADMDLPWIDGYKPKSNVQGLLREVVEAYVQQHQEVLSAIIENFGQSPARRSTEADSTDVIQPVPRLDASLIALKLRPNRLRLPRKLNFVLSDYLNKKLGRDGEEFVFEYERRRLTQAGRPDLAAQVIWTSRDEGDGAGYDIQSFQLDGEKIYIEVKTTNAGAGHPFLLSRNEVGASEELGTSFLLYRIYDFRNSPKIYILKGPLSQSATLEPQSYRALPQPNAMDQDL